MKIFLFLFLVLINMHLFADIHVSYDIARPAEQISTQVINDTEYFNVFELNKAFHAQINEDVLNRRLIINLYTEQFIVLFDSNYLLHNKSIYAFEHNLVTLDGKLYLPTSIFPMIFNEILEPRLVWKDNKIKAQAPVDNSIRRIVIDPGHGGKDPGAVSRRNHEKTIVLKIAKKLKKRLEDELGLEVFLTRSRDQFVSLQKRTKYANAQDADVFISLHCNASLNKRSHGVEVYFLSTNKTTDRRAKAALKLENSVVEKYEGGAGALKKYDDLAFILMDMAQSEHLEESSQLAMQIQENLVKTCKSEDRGVKQAGFYVLKGAFMPAVLVELGFISNRREEKLLITRKYQDKLVLAISEGIKKFKYKYDGIR